MIIIIIVLFLCLNNHLTEHASIANKNNLTKTDCSYNDGRFGRIDLSQVGLKHDTPAFRHVVNGDYFYSYNPCYPFSEEFPCTNVAACQILKDGSEFHVLGLNSIVSWLITIDGKATLVYSTSDRQTVVNLACWDQIDQLVIHGEYEPRHYNLTLFSKCACWNGC